MYDYFKGTLSHISPAKATVEVSGIGYQFFIPVSSYSHLSHLLGQAVVLYASFVVREDSHRLFGFVNPKERELFETLSDVSGIGPKTALAIIGHLSPKELDSAIYEQDVATLSKVPGIGKKTAERLIVEMKDKLKNLKPLLEDSSTPQDSSIVSDAVSALVHLGYQQPLAQKAVKQAFKEASASLELAELITVSLKTLHALK
jgi:Holliday junction DNA helicase RuvA